MRPAPSSSSTTAAAAPPEYVGNALVLCDASTAMASHGRPVDHSLVVVDGPVDAAGLWADAGSRVRRVTGPCPKRSMCDRPIDPD